MIPKNNSYFSPELLEGGHYIITGLLDENYMSDLYQQVDVTEILHTELKNNDFDVIVYYDYINRLYCYDARSAYLLTHANDEPNNIPAVAEDDDGSEDGPLGPVVLAAEEPEMHQDGNDTYNLRMLPIDVAWGHIISLLRQTRYRCGIVFANMTGLSFDFPQEALQALTELNSTITDRPHSAFYIFRSAKGVDFSEYGRSGNPVWDMFYQQILRPLFETNDPAKNRVISLSTPNAREITNLLNMLRLRDHNTLRINLMEFKKLSEEIAYTCATNNRSLRSLKVSLEEYIKDCIRTGNTRASLTLANYQEAIGVKREKTALEEINSLIGLENVKSWIREWTSSKKKDGMAREFPAASSRFYPNVKSSVKNGLILNIVFTGKPGTGKSTLAKQIGRLYYELGLLPRGHLVECSASNIVSQNVGGTAPLVRERVMEAMGGVLMIDEAYALSKNAHGKEAIDQLVNEMTQYAGQFAVVICGYESPMKKFLAANQGLASRFATSLHLEDYSPEEMEQIFKLFMQNEDENGYTCALDSDLEKVFPDFCDNWANDHDNNWGNAREAGTLLENMKRRALARMRENGQKVEGTRIILTADDIPSQTKRHLEFKPRNVEEIIKKLKNETIGLYNVKDRLVNIAQTISWDAGEVSVGRYIFHGPPGTGKTHMARLFCNLLFRLGILKRNYVYEVSAKQLCHPDPEFDYGLDNGREPTIMEILEGAFENAKGGIIFIDEAPQLLDSELGQNVLRALVPIIDRPDVYENTCVILAGYTDKITCLLSDDDGLGSRFPVGNRIRFDNYSAEDLAKLSEHFAAKKGHTVTEGFKERTRAAFSRYLENPEENFGNARYIRDTYIPSAIEAKNSRLSRQEKGDEKAIATKEDVKNVEKPTRTKLTDEDIPAPFNKLAGPTGIPVMPELNAWQKVDSLVGKQEIKDYLNSLSENEKSVQFYDEVRAAESHFAIIGPTGSGRHTAARVIASVLKQIGVIERDEVYVTSKGSFEAQYVGQTIPKTLAEIEKAKGGCMLVEYPSSMLVKSMTDNTFGTEALSTIGGAMAGGSDKLSIIFIDDEDGFEALTKQMPSIISRFSRVFHIEDLTPFEMSQLFNKKTEHSFVIHDEIKDLMPDFFINWVSQRGDLKENSAVWSGGCEVDKLITDIRNNWKNTGERPDISSGAPKRRITRKLFPEKLQRFLTEASADKNMALRQLDDLAGLYSVKNTIKAIEREMRYYHSKALPGFYAFVGDPGSGKTMVAKLFGGVLRGAGVLSQGHVIIRTAKDLAQKPSSFEECLKLAKNGVLFIDEAPSLLKTVQGCEVIDKLLTTVEDTDIMKDVCIILAGYEHAMYKLFDYDIGFKSRFEVPNAIVRFENYTAEQMLAIMDSFAAKADTDSYIRAPFKLNVSDPDFRRTSEQVFELERKRENFGNGRFVRNYLKASIFNLLERVDNMPDDVDKTDKELLSTLNESDIPSKYIAALERKEKPAIIHASKLDTQTVDPITSENYSDTLERVKRSTVLIMAELENGGKSTGTGFIISKDGYILTCNHVFRGAKNLKAKVYTPGAIGGDYHIFDVEALKPGYEHFDMALGKINGCNFETLSIRPLTEGITEDEETFMVGFPLGGTINGGDLEALNPSHYDGKISSAQTLPRGSMRTDIFCFDTTGMPGCSGSPVISTKDGRVIGVFPGAIPDNQDKEKAKHNVKFFFPIKYFWGSFVDFGSEENNE